MTWHDTRATIVLENFSTSLLHFQQPFQLGVFKITEKTDKTEEKLTEKTEPK
jgi:hypothetical protein